MFIRKFRARIEYRPGRWNYLADALSRLYEGEDNNPIYLTDPTNTSDDSSNQTPVYAFTSEEQLFTMSDFEPLTEPEDQAEYDIGAHSECGSECSRLRKTINDWGDTRSLSSGRSQEEIEHSALHWTACHEVVCDIHDSLKPPKTIYPLQGE